MEFPVTIRMPYGGGVRAPELHDDSPEAYYVHTPGVKVAIPSTPADAKGLLASAIREPDPVVILEPKLHYRTMRGEVPEGEYTVPLGEARLAREGTDVTLVAYGSMVPLCEQAADALEGEASVEVLDLRTLKPLDEDALLASAAKTGRVVIVQEAPRTAGFGAELAAILAEKAILDLRGPVIRVTGYDVPYPYWQIEDAYMPSVERVDRRRPEAARVLMRRTLVWRGIDEPRMEIARAELDGGELSANGTMIGAGYELRYELEPGRLQARVVDGPEVDVGLDGTDYFDLNFSPLFNTLPLLDGLSRPPTSSCRSSWCRVSRSFAPNSGTSRSATGSCGTARATSWRRSSSTTTGSSRGTSISPTGCS